MSLSPGRLVSHLRNPFRMGTEWDLETKSCGGDLELSLISGWVAQLREGFATNDTLMALPLFSVCDPPYGLSGETRMAISQVPLIEGRPSLVPSKCAGGDSFNSCQGIHCASHLLGSSTVGLITLAISSSSSASSK